MRVWRRVVSAVITMSLSDLRNDKKKKSKMRNFVFTSSPLSIRPLVNQIYISYEVSITDLKTIYLNYRSVGSDFITFFTCGYPTTNVSSTSSHVSNIKRVCITTKYTCIHCGHCTN